ncbi:hypothetical protein BKA61DRAFT_567412 [Leptodontidium sp. MPI-SDFR-AT-0119]|nr:hypothetical protein BKA61DRAFT_567412 [Leptodontidium sp. MPI-SDFR-AT-0119]
MSSPPKYMLTSSTSQTSTLGDGLSLGDTGVVGAHDIVIEVQKRAKQICDTDQERFRRFYNDELRRKRSEQFLSRERPRGEPVKTLHAREGVLDFNRAAQETVRVRQEPRAKDDQLRENGELARQRAWQEQRVKDDQLLESYRLAKLEDAERRRELRLQQDKARRRVKQARDDSAMGSLLRHEADIETRRRQDVHLQDAALSAEARSRDVEMIARDNKRRALQGLEDDHRRRERAYRDNASARALQRHKVALQAQKSQQRTEGHIAAFDGVLPSFLDQEY